MNEVFEKQKTFGINIIAGKLQNFALNINIYYVHSKLIYKQKLSAINIFYINLKQI